MRDGFEHVEAGRIAKRRGDQVVQEGPPFCIHVLYLSESDGFNAGIDTVSLNQLRLVNGEEMFWLLACLVCFNLKECNLVSLHCTMSQMLK